MEPVQIKQEPMQINQETMTIKQEPAQINQEPVQPIEKPLAKDLGGSSRKRSFDDNDPQSENEPVAIRIKMAHDLFEQEDFGGNSSSSSPTKSTASSPIKINNERPSTFSTQNGPVNSGSSATSDPIPIVNAFEFASSVLFNPLFNPVGKEMKVNNPTVQKEKENAVGPKVNIPKVPHYDAHDEDDEIKYIEENRAKTAQHIDDHNKINASAAQDGDSDEEDQDGYNHGPLITPRRQNVYGKYDFKSRHICATRLAVFTAKDKILNAIENHRVVIVDGFTGCGKTTQVPQFILDQHCENDKYCNIVVTQPRKIAAISVAQRVCFERKWKLGQVVGYQVGMETKRDRNDTLLTYMTTGVLLQKLINKKNFGNMTHIIIDEVHERDLECDMLLLVIKKILQNDSKGRERHLKLILMSATMDSSKFSQYFPMRTCVSEVEESPVIIIPHSFRHKVDEYFLDDIISSNKANFAKLKLPSDLNKATLSEEMYTVGVNCIASLDEYDNKLGGDPCTSSSGINRGSVLVFLPGMEEINRLTRYLKDRNEIDLENAIKNKPDYKEHDFHKWDIVRLHSKVTAEEQQRVFEQPEPKYRKLILSTNIGESSITVPDVVCVIDFCLTKSLCIDPDTNFTTLRMVWASISQCIQRKGRTGRVCDGKVFRLVSKSFFSEFPKHTKPEMQRSNLETVVLQLKKLSLGAPTELLAMALDAPVVSGIERSIANLKELGALTIRMALPTREVRYETCDGDLTFFGSIMADLPIPQQCTKLIMLGHCFGVMKEAIIIASALSRNPFCTRVGRPLDAYLSRLNWSNKSCSDLFVLYSVYKHWVKQFAKGATDQDDSRRNRSTCNERQWAYGASVQLSMLREIKSTVDLIEERLIKHIPHLAQNSLRIETSADDLEKNTGIMLKLAIAGAFYPNYFRQKRHDDQALDKNGSKEINGSDVFNTVYFKGFPGGHEGKIYAKCVADYLGFGLNVPAIKFEGQKVLATFDTRGDKIGPISKGIYCAIKRQQNRDMLEIPLISTRYEKIILDDWNKCIQQRKFNECPPLVPLPRVDITSASVRVTHVENPGQFWVVYLSNIDARDEMVDRINDELVHMPIHMSKVIPNALCIAPFEGTYHRAKILIVLPIPTDESLVYFIDYGNTTWVKNSALQDLSYSMVAKNYHTIPCLAVECRLSNIKPAKIHGGGWHDTAKQELIGFAENAPFLYIDIYSVSKSIIVGRLIGHAHDGVEQNLNDRLVHLGFAEVTEEDSMIKFNHQARKRVNLQDEIEREAHNKEQIGQQLDFDLIHTNLNNYRRTNIVLKGPYSPLEVNFQPLCYSSNTKKVKVDTNSVNSVVLETEPISPIPRLLVAAAIEVQSRSGVVIARDTTLMPAIPGILSLMSMLFAPKIELRTDIRQTKYTGVLCGLGSTPGQSDLPVYPAHDMEIIFDTCIDDADIDSINHIRYLMNLILRQKPGASVVNLSQYQMQVQQELLALLLRRRNAVEEIWPPQDYVWNQLDANSLIPPAPNCFMYEPQAIFAPHYKVKLKDDSNVTWSWDFAL